MAIPHPPEQRPDRNGWRRRHRSCTSRCSFPEAPCRHRERGAPSHGAVAFAVPRSELAGHLRSVPPGTHARARPAETSARSANQERAHATSQERAHATSKPRRPRPHLASKLSRSRPSSTATPSGTPPLNDAPHSRPRPAAPLLALPAVLLRLVDRVGPTGQALRRPSLGSQRQLQRAPGGPARRPALCCAPAPAGRRCRFHATAARGTKSRGGPRPPGGPPEVQLVSRMAQLLVALGGAQLLHEGSPEGESRAEGRAPSLAWPSGLAECRASRSVRSGTNRPLAATHSGSRSARARRAIAGSARTSKGWLHTTIPPSKLATDLVQRSYTLLHWSGLHAGALILLLLAVRVTVLAVPGLVRAVAADGILGC